MHYCICRYLDQHFVLDLLSNQIEMKSVKKKKKKERKSNVPQELLTSVLNRKIYFMIIQ